MAEAVAGDVADGLLRLAADLVRDAHRRLLSGVCSPRLPGRAGANRPAGPALRAAIGCAHDPPVIGSRHVAQVG